MDPENTFDPENLPKGQRQVPDFFNQPQNTNSIFSTVVEDISGEGAPEGCSRSVVFVNRLIRPHHKDPRIKKDLGIAISDSITDLTFLFKIPMVNRRRIIILSEYIDYVLDSCRSQRIKMFSHEGFRLPIGCKSVQEFTFWTCPAYLKRSYKDAGDDFDWHANACCVGQSIFRRVVNPINKRITFLDESQIISKAHVKLEYSMDEFPDCSTMLQFDVRCIEEMFLRVAISSILLRYQAKTILEDPRKIFVTAVENYKCSSIIEGKMLRNDILRTYTNKEPVYPTAKSRKGMGYRVYENFIIRTEGSLPCCSAC